MILLKVRCSYFNSSSKPYIIFERSFIKNINGYKLISRARNHPKISKNTSNQLNTFSLVFVALTFNPFCQSWYFFYMQVQLCFKELYLKMFGYFFPELPNSKVKKWRRKKIDFQNLFLNASCISIIYKGVNSGSSTAGLLNLISIS